MIKWINVKNLPKESCYVWVIHEKSYPHHPIQAFYNELDKNFTFGPHNYLLPSTVPLQVTHYLPFPEGVDE